jgi:hypothetical protein
MRHLPEGGFQSRPYECLSYLHPLRSLRPIFYCLLFLVTVGVMDFALRQWQTSQNYKS